MLSFEKKKLKIKFKKKKSKLVASMTGETNIFIRVFFFF